MDPAEVKLFASCLEEISANAQTQLFPSTGADVLEVNGFPLCTVDLTSPLDLDTQTALIQTAGQDVNAEVDVDVWQTTKRAILSDESSTFPYDVTRRRILDYYSGVDGDADIQTERLKITLICPLSKSRIKVPSRSRQCGHLQCFDLENFLRSNVKREKPKCPVCGVEVDFDKLLVDEYFQVVLSITDEAAATEVELLHNGGFRFPQPVAISGCLLSAEAVITLSDDEAEDGEVVDAESDGNHHEQRDLGNHQRVDANESAGATLSAHSRMGEAHVPRVSSDQTAFMCRVCKKRYPSKATLDAHLSGSHLPKMGAHLCVTCGDGFVSELARDDHEDRAHGQKVVFWCKVCRKEFSLRSAREQHMRASKSCASGFATEALRDNHEDTAHGTKIFRCEVCGKVFGTRSGREQHISAKGHADQPQGSPATNRAAVDPIMADVLQAANDIERTVGSSPRVFREPPRGGPVANVRMPLFHPYYRPPPAIVYPNYGMPPFDYAAALPARYANPGHYVPFAPMAYGFPPPQGPPVFPPNPFVYHP